MLSNGEIDQLGEFGNVVVSLQYVEVPSHNSEKDSACICSITKIIDCNTTTSWSTLIFVFSQYLPKYWHQEYKKIFKSPKFKGDSASVIEN